MSDDETRPEGPISSSIERLRREFDRWLEIVTEQGGRALDKFGLRSSKVWHPVVDLIETAEEVHVHVDLPGVDPQAVDVSIAGNMLTIKGESAPAPSPEAGSLHLTERPHGPFERSLPMPVPVDPEAVTAESRAGVLHVRLGKAERAKTRQIRVVAE